MKITKKLISLFLLLVLVGGGCSLDKQTDTKNSETLGGEKKDLEKMIDKENIDMSDWNTYENKEYGFRFRYPDNINLNINPEQNSFSESLNFNFADEIKNFISITNLKLREKNIITSNYNYSNDNIRFDINSKKNIFYKTIKPVEEKIKCNREYIKVIGQIDYLVQLSCFFADKFYYRFGYETFIDNYYISAWIDVGQLLVDDGAIENTDLGIVEDDEFINIQSSKKTGQAVNLLELILSTLEFNV